MSKLKKDRKWIVHPDVELTMDDIKKYYNMQEKELLVPEELQSPNLTTLPVDNIVIEEAVVVNETVDISKEDLDKKNYIKVSSTFYILPVNNEDENSEIELFKILNPVENTVETRELTKEEEKEILVVQLKEKTKTFHPLTHPKKTINIVQEADIMGRTSSATKTKMTVTNKTLNKFGVNYKKKRKSKNKLSKASRKANR